LTAAGSQQPGTARCGKHDKLTFFESSLTERNRWPVRTWKGNSKWVGRGDGESCHALSVKRRWRRGISSGFVERESAVTSRSIAFAGSPASGIGTNRPARRDRERDKVITIHRPEAV